MARMQANTAAAEARQRSAQANQLRVQWSYAESRVREASRQVSQARREASDTACYSAAASLIGGSTTAPEDTGESQACPES